MAGQPHNPQWQQHVARLEELLGSRAGASRPAARPATVDSREAEEARRGEWTATPPGPLGRRLLADVDPYLAFFAVARDA